MRPSLLRASPRAFRQMRGLPCDWMTMEAATPLRPFHVTFTGDRLRIDGLIVEDDCAVRLAREREEAAEDPADLILQAIEIGARVLDREQAAANTEYVKAEFERQAREVEQQFGERARLAGEQLENAVTAAFGAETGSVPRLLEKHFGAESSGAVQHQVKALVDELLRSHRESLTKQFTTADESNPLAQFQRSAVGAIKQASDQQHVHLVAMNDTDHGAEGRGRAAQGRAGEDRGRRRGGRARNREGPHLRGAGRGRDRRDRPPPRRLRLAGRRHHRGRRQEGRRRRRPRGAGRPRPRARRLRGQDVADHACRRRSAPSTRHASSAAPRSPSSSSRARTAFPRRCARCRSCTGTSSS